MNLVNLTKGELSVLQRLASGKTQEQIAQDNGAKLISIKVGCRRIMSKLKIHGIADLIQFTKTLTSDQFVSHRKAETAMSSVDPDDDNNMEFKPLPPAYVSRPSKMELEESARQKRQVPVKSIERNANHHLSENQRPIFIPKCDKCGVTHSSAWVCKLERYVDPNPVIPSEFKFTPEALRMIGVKA